MGRSGSEREGTMASVLEMIAGLPTAPVARKLEMRQQAYDVLRMFTPRALPGVGAFGIDVFVDDSLPVPWRLLDSDGNVMAQASPLPPDKPEE